MRFEMVSELISRVPAPRTVLDIGCGLGELYGYLKKNHVGCNFYGTDFADSAITRNRAKYPDAQWVAGDIGELPFDDAKFDVVVSCETLEHMEDPQKLADDMMRHCKPAGTIILTTPFMNQIGSREHLWSFTEEDIKTLFPGYDVKFARLFPTLIIAQITRHV